MCAPCSMSVAAHLKARSFKQTAGTDAALAGDEHEHHHGRQKTPQGRWVWGELVGMLMVSARHVARTSRTHTLRRRTSDHVG